MHTSHSSSNSYYKKVLVYRMYTHTVSNLKYRPPLLRGSSRDRTHTNDTSVHTVTYGKEQCLVHSEPAVHQGNFTWLQHWVSDTAHRESVKSVASTILIFSNIHSY